MNPRERKQRGDEIQRKALDVPRSLELEDFAKVAKRKKVTMEKYRELKIRMPREVRERIAGFLEEHAENLKGIATDLRDSAPES